MTTSEQRSLALEDLPTAGRLTVIDWSPAGGVRFLDQTALPTAEVWREVRSVEGMIEALRALRVRGAPLIGVAAAMGLAAAAAEAVRRDVFGPRWVDEAVRRLAAARPTAVNLRWALDRMARAARDAFDFGDDPAPTVEALRAEADQIRREEVDRCEAIGAAGADLIAAGARVLTHCNTGALATGGIGTALGVIVTAHRRHGGAVSVVACEARPLNQGARLTTWELVRAGVPCRAIVDSAAAWLMAGHHVDLVIVGADRIAANGDVANKIGTYGLAVAARHHGIPFYVAAPSSTFDPALPDGVAIPIEVRDSAELAVALGAEPYNPAFDVTPGELITAIVTEHGVLEPPYEAAIARLLG